MLGLDLVEIYRIKNNVENYGNRFLQRIYTPSEIKYCLNKNFVKYPELAARFAAKEAVVKALGTGMRGVGWKEIEIIHDPLGKPKVFFHSRARDIANQLGIEEVHISLSHTKDTAAAVAFIEYVVQYEEEVLEEEPLAPMDNFQ